MSNKRRLTGDDNLEKIRDFKGVWIPKEIYMANDLNWTEKILLVEIDTLDGTEGCFESNSYFSGLLKVSKASVSKAISSLIDKGYVTRSFTYKQHSRQIDKRILHTTVGFTRAPKREW